MFKTRFKRTALGVAFSKHMLLINIHLTNHLFVLHFQLPLSGNFDMDTPQYHFFEKPFIARWLKIIPHEWNIWPCMRFDFWGCEFGRLLQFYLFNTHKYTMKVMQCKI